MDRDTQTHMVDMSRRLAKVEAGQMVLETKIDANHKILESKLEPLGSLVTTVQDHDRQINRWKGVNALLAFVVSVVGAAYIRARGWF